MLALALAPAVCKAATLTVTNTADSGAGTLRTLIAGASSGDTINFTAALSGQTITLTSGVLLITNVSPLTINASSLPGGITVSGNNSSRVFHVANGAAASLTALTIRNGNAGTFNGGGILSEGTLWLTNCTLTANSATNGGGVSVSVAGNATIRGCTFYNNTGWLRAGGLHIAGIAKAMECTFSGNRAGNVGGGAVCVVSPLSPVATLESCTISGNQCTNTGVGGGILHVNGTVTNINCIVAGNTIVASGSGSNIVGTFYFNGMPQLLNVNPMLAPLGNYGGPTQTMPPLAGSPAIDGATSGTGFTTDQRGFARVVGAFADLGAVEYGSGPVVTTTLDGGVGSLRYSCAYAGNGSTITFDSPLSGQTITLTSGQITLTNNLTIDASSLPGGITVSGNHNSRVFQVTTAAVAALANLTIQNGAAGAGYGGGIWNQGTLLLTNITLTGNVANQGGGIQNDGTLTLNACTLAGNSSTNYGGGIANGGPLTVNNSTLSGNSSAALDGGGIANFAALALNNSTLSANTADAGGGIANYFAGAVTLNNCTLSGNSAGPEDGGGINIYLGSAALTNCTLAGNSAVNLGGGINNAGGTLTLVNTMVAGNSASSGANINGSFSGTANLTSGNPLLAPLGNYGGPTQTRPPLPGSPAINAGINSVTNSLATDQRGSPRRASAQVDLGAVELQTPSLVVTTNSDSGPGSLRQVVSQADVSAMITFAPGLSGQTILLTSGQLTLSNTLATLAIDASSLPGGIAVSGNNSSRVFEVAAGAVVHLSALHIKDGYAPNGDNPTNSGGGILNRGTLALTNCTLTANQALQGSKPKGGAIANYLSAASLTLQNCLISSNHSDAYGGGGIEVNGGVASINQCTFTANSCINGNGGGIYVEAGSVTLNQCTVSSNSASTGGGVARSGSLTINNSIVAGNVAASAPNISGSFSGTRNLTSGNPLLAPLGNFGGRTLTMPPLPGSPAIDGCTSGTSFVTDQRGQPRIVGAFADIGAVEGVFNPAMPLINPVRLGNGSFQFSFANLSGLPFTVFATTNVAAPLNTWLNLGPAVEAPPGTFTFTDLQATNYPQRFYQVRGP